MRTYKPSYRMRRVLAAMVKTGAHYIWDGHNRWIGKDGKEQFWIEGESAPTATVSDAMLRQGFVEETRPGPRFKLTYTITEKGKEAAK